MARNANKHRREFTFEVGDTVWLAASHLRMPRALTAKRKLLPRYYGPYKITKVLSDVAYELELPKHFKIHPVIHVSHLKANEDGSLDFPTRPAYKAPPPPIIQGEDDDAEEYFQIEALRNHRFTGKGKNRCASFLVSWEGQDESENIWISEKRLRIDMQPQLVDGLISQYVLRTGAKLS